MGWEVQRTIRASGLRRIDERGAVVKPHIYRNIVILPADMNSSGIRWIARLGTGIPLRTETLRDMREAIKNALRKKEAQS